ncbi:MAG TPA: GTPase Era [Blastocatellia bacterium]|nr:GTPase Era [Blastocatellia bacterium]
MSFKSGFAALIGRPNAGKSTLLNKLVGEKIAAVSDKPQTTRTRISGVLTRPEGQIIFVDTPGIHKPGYKLNRRMMQTVEDALQSVDIRLLLVDATSSFGKGDQFTVELIKKSEGPSFLLLNKIDLLKDKSKLLPLIEQYSHRAEFAEVIPISAISGDGSDLLISKILEYLPEGPQLFPEDTLTDQPERTIVAEMVREKILKLTKEELPYATAVVTERFEDQEDIVRLYCAIFVERDSQKAIVIGRGGQSLKHIGTEARRDIEKLLGKRVYLELFVKVQPQWRDNEAILDTLGVDKREM